MVDGAAGEGGRAATENTGSGGFGEKQNRRNVGGGPVGMSDRKPEDRWGVAGWALVLVAFAIGLANLPLRVLGWRFDHLPGDGIDNRLNNFVLEHGYRYLTGRVEGFWDAPAFYPVPRMTACSDAHIGLLPAYSGFRSAGLAPERAFQAWFVLGFVLNYGSAVWVLRRLGVGIAGTAAGASLFTFGVPVVGQLMHAQLLPRFLVPPAVWFGWTFLRAPRRGRLVACLACVVAQFYVSVYIGILLAAMLATGGVLGTATGGGLGPLRAGHRTWLLRGGILATAAAALYPLIREHRQIGAAKDEYQIRRMAPGPLAWLTPPPIVLSGELLPFREAEYEHRVFPGFVPLAALGIGLVLSARSPAGIERRRIAAVSTWTVLLLALAVTDFGPFWAYRPVLSLPGGGAMRAVGRIVLVLLFPLAVIVAMGVDEVVRRAARHGRIWSSATGLLVVGLVTADQWLLTADVSRTPDWVFDRYPLGLVLCMQGAIEDAIGRHPRPTLLYAFPHGDRLETPNMVLQLEAMRASQDMGIPCVNGYSGYFPSGWKLFRTRDQVMSWLEDNRAPADRGSGIVYYGEGR
jgi:hypothetical protein